MKNGIFPGIRKLAKDYDLIQVHEYDQITSWIYYTDKKFKDKVIIYHGPYYSEFNVRYNKKCKLFDNIFLKLKSNSECLCVTKSNSAADFLLSKGFKNVKPVGVGLDTSAWKEELYSDKNKEAENLCSKRETFTYLYIGKLEPRRNIIFLLDVVENLLRTNQNAQFLLIGDGDKAYKEKCLSKIQKWIECERVEYISSVNQAEMPKIYSRVDCMLFPSVYEIFGMVLMEAIYFGVPVITSNNGGADTLIRDGENGVVINSNDVIHNGKLKHGDGYNIGQWTDAANKMYIDTQFYDRVKAQLKIDRELLSWDNVANKILGHLYEK